MFVIRFVNLMEGHIWIESEGLGKGCTVIFIVKLCIPGRSNESKSPFLPKANHGQAGFPGLKVLVLDYNGSVKFHSHHSLYINCIWYGVENLKGKCQGSKI